VSNRGAAMWQLFVTRLRSFYREPGAIFWTFLFPILLSVALGIAFRNRPPEPSAIAIERGPAGDTLAETLAKSPDLRVKLLDAEDARAALRTGKVDLVVAPGPPPTYHFDPMRTEGRLARLLVDDALQRASGRADAVRVAEARVTAPGARYIDFLVPGLVGMGLMTSGLWGVGYTIVETRSRRLLKRLVATPMRRSDFLLGFVLVRALFLIVELPVLLGFGAIAFGVPMRGSIALLAAVAVLGSLTFAGIGLLVASRAENNQTVSGLINVVSMPMYITSGTFFSSAKFPDVMQPVIRALPLTALNDAMRAVMLDGAGPLAVAPQVGILTAWSVASFTAALWMFRWR
jgi:ABC-2 type transport system permease protein